MTSTKHLFLALGLLALVSCTEMSSNPATHPTLPNLRVAKVDLNLVRETGLMMYGDHPFTGWLVKHYPNGTLAEETGYWEGKKQADRKLWYADGTLSYHATYDKGRLAGMAHSWWPDGQMRSESRYENGAGHGIQRQWYKSGALFKEKQLNHGRELGLQRAWRENGKLYVNYEAKNGRIFGLKRAGLCYNVEDEVVK